MSLTLLAAFLVSQGAAAPMPQGIPAPETVAALVGDWVAATGPGGLDLAGLEKKGWARGEARNERGTPIMALFQKASDMTMMSVALAKPNDCMVLSPVSTPAGIGAIRDALDAALGVEGASSAGAETTWLAANHRITLTTIGNAQVQGVRASVRSLEKK